MTAHKKPFPWPAVSVSFGIVVFVGGVIASNAVQAEKVKQLEAKTITMCAEQKEVDRENSSEHKAMMASLTRIETKLEYVPTIGRSRRVERDSTR